MSRRTLTALLAFLVLPAAACGAEEKGKGRSAPKPPIVAAGFALEAVAAGLPNLVDIQPKRDGSLRLLLVLQDGIVRELDRGRLVELPFLDIRARVSCCGERGLLGLAVHPGFRTNRRFFVDYTDRNGDTVIAEYRAGADGRADPASARVILAVPQPFSNHNGGQVAFGPDGYLYVALGDGGSAHDPAGNSQNLGSRLGKLLRIDVDSGSPYAVPADNPFAGEPGAQPEIWSFGLRNPWRFSFDRANGDLWIGDVGQNAVEEIDLATAASGRGRGANFGWDVLEGSRCHEPPSGCSSAGTVLPVAEYAHSGSDDCSVTGGFVYRGRRIPSLAGTYVFADFCSGRLRVLERAGGAFVQTVAKETGFMISTFGEDESGELYLARYASGNEGALYRIVPAAGSGAGTP